MKTPVVLCLREEITPALLHETKSEVNVIDVVKCVMCGMHGASLHGRVGEGAQDPGLHDLDELGGGRDRVSPSRVGPGCLPCLPPRRQVGVIPHVVNVMQLADLGEPSPDRLAVLSPVLQTNPPVCNNGK